MAWRTALLVAKNEVNPFVQMCRDIVALECLAANACELFAVRFSPWRQFHVRDLMATVAVAESGARQLHIRE